MNKQRSEHHSHKQETKSTHTEVENALVKTNESLKKLRDALGLQKDHFISKIIEDNEGIISGF